MNLAGLNNAQLALIVSATVYSGGSSTPFTEDVTRSATQYETWLDEHNPAGRTMWEA